MYLFPKGNKNAIVRKKYAVESGKADSKTAECRKVQNIEMAVMYALK